MVIDFDVDGDGKITAEEIAMKERMLEVELREEKAESQKFMAWVAMGMMIVFTVILFTPLLSDKSQTPVSYTHLTLPTNREV